MLKVQRKHYSETFIVWNENINLVGALIPLDKEKVSVSGTVRFKNGEKLSFSAESYDCEILHQKLLSICHFIAKCYGTNVIHRKVRVTNFTNDTSDLKTDPFLLN